MTDLEKRAARMKWAPPATGTEERKKMPASAFLSPSTRTFPYKVNIDGEWVVSEKGLRSAISVANFRGNSGISAKASRILEDLVRNEIKQSDDTVDDVLQHFGVPGMKWGVRRQQQTTTPGKKSIKTLYKENSKAHQERTEKRAQTYKTLSKSEKIALTAQQLTFGRNTATRVLNDMSSNSKSFNEAMTVESKRRGQRVVGGLIGSAVGSMLVKAIK